MDGRRPGPGATQTTFTFNAHLADFKLRPFRNFAEISDDSAAGAVRHQRRRLDARRRPDQRQRRQRRPDGDGYGPVGAPAAGGVDNIDADDAGNGNDGEDDADIADVDLPLDRRATTSPSPRPSTRRRPRFDGTITYTITVQNQGVLDSRQFTVTDSCPAGLAVVELGRRHVDNGDGTITWTIANLEPGDVTIAHASPRAIADITLRPFRNIAEITADSADYYTIDGEPVADVDSIPTPTRQRRRLRHLGAAGRRQRRRRRDRQAGVGADPEDDADIADVDVPVTYDLALIKTGPAHDGPDGQRRRSRSPWPTRATCRRARTRSPTPSRPAWS